LERIAGVDPSRFVFYDESGAKTNMTRLYGRTLDGGRLVDAVPHGHWSTTSLLSSFRLDGSTAAMTLPGATDRLAFDAYVEHVLVPSLRRGDIVVLDNLAPHKSPRAAEQIRQAGAELWFLPPYSPDLNPIEKMWSKVKAHLRRLKARTAQTLDRAVATALRTITPADAQGWFRHCGYRYTQA
jgi:transposase